LILGHRHLEHVPRTHIRHYKNEPPHRGLALQPPGAPPLESPPARDVQRRDPLVHEYYRAAA
jgi:hypothetical protein